MIAFDNGRFETVFFRPLQDESRRSFGFQLLFL